MTIKAVLFDLGETLFNYGDVDINGLFREGARLTYDYLRQFTGGNSLPSFKTYCRHHIISIKWHYFWSWLTRKEFDCMFLLDKKARDMGLKLNERQLEELAWLWYEPLGNMADIEPELPECLQELQEMSLQLAIISNTFLPASVLDKHLDRFDLLHFFSLRQYSSVTIYRKPDRRIYQLTLDQLAVLPSEAVMVGDKLKEDILGPARLGIRGIFKRGSNNLHQNIPSHVPVIETISELPELINTMQN
ncbi:MAG: HAD family hydrolase [Sedimentisphaerales bacterium]|nr:HAD family hydrolase [Sedimentisphaerales bacterium]